MLLVQRPVHQACQVALVLENEGGRCFACGLEAHQVGKMAHEVQRMLIGGLRSGRCPTAVGLLACCTVAESEDVGGAGGLQGA